MATRYAAPPYPDPFGDEVIQAWAMTTKAQREMVMADWETGRQIYHEQVAHLLHLNPDALRLACFLEFEHPSVCKPNGRPRLKHYGKLCEMMKKYPVDNSPKSVDNHAEAVDKSVEITVDKISTYPQAETLPGQGNSGSSKLSTYPHFIHTPPVDKMD